MEFEVKEMLDSIAKMAESEMALNAQIKDADEALRQLGNARKALKANRKLSTMANSLRKRIKKHRQITEGREECGAHCNEPSISAKR